MEIKKIADEKDVDMVLITGDLFHRRNPQPHENNLLAKFLIEIVSKKIPIAIIRGNHELPRISGGEHAIGIYRTLEIPGVYIVDNEKPATIITKSGKVQVAGIPYPTKQDARKLIGEGFKANPENWARYFDMTIEKLSRMLDTDIPSILAAHTYISGAKSARGRMVFNKSEPIAMISSFANPKFDYIGIGHIHRHQVIPAGPGQIAIYSGSIVRTSFAEEKQEKGIVIADIQKGKMPEYEFIPLKNAQKMVTIEADIRGNVDIVDAIKRSIHSRNLDDAIIRFYYKTEREKPPIRRAILKQTMPEAFKIIPMRSIVSENHEQKRSHRIKTAEPITELGAYIDSIGKYESRKNEILELAKKIINERNREMDIFEKDSN